MLDRTLRGLMGGGIGALALAAALAAAPALAQQQVRLSYHWGPTHPSAGFANQFAERLTERSNGALNVAVFPSAQLFGIREVLGGVSSGAVQIGMAVGISSFPPLDPNYSITAMPGLFDGFEQMRGFFAETDEGRGLMDGIQSTAGIRIVGHNPVGPTAVFSAIEDLSTVEALQAASARVLSDADRVRWEALGARRTVSLPTDEVYTALQSGMINTVATVAGALPGYSWWDHLNAVQMPYFQFADAYIIVNEGWFSGLSRELQDLVLAVGAEITAESTTAILDASSAIIEQFVERGGTVFTLEGDELARMQAIERDVIYPRLGDMVSAEMVEAALAYTSGD